MGTATFTDTDPSIVWGGTTEDTTVAGTAARFFLSHGAECYLGVNGSGLLVNCYEQTTGQLDFTVDGSTVTPTITTNAFTTYTPFSGASDTLHLVRIKRGASMGFGEGGPLLRAADAFVVTGGSPTLSLPTGFGSNAPVSVGNTLYISSDWTQGVSADIEATANVFQGSQAGGSGTGHGWQRFRATTSGFWIWCYCGGDKFAIVIDGNVAGAIVVTTPSLGSWGWIQVTGLDNTTEHEYNIVNSAKGTAGSCYVGQVILTDGTFNTTAIAARDLWAWYGDSKTANPVTLFYQGFPELFSINTLRAPYNAAIAGTYVQTSLGGATSGQSRYADITGLAHPPARVVIEYGYNDANQDTGGTQVAAFQSSYETMLNGMIAGLPSVPIVVLGYLPTTASVAAANRDAYNAAIQAAIAACSNPSQCIYKSTDGVIDPTAGVDTLDGTHLNVSGNAKVAAWLAGLFPAAGGVTSYPASILMVA